MQREFQVNSGETQICELADPRPGAKALIHSAAGGVGGSLVQVAKILGCEVVGVVGGTHKVETERTQGADHVIDVIGKSKEDLWVVAKRPAPEGYDVILDANGVATLADSRCWGWCCGSCQNPSRGI